MKKRAYELKKKRTLRHIIIKIMLTLLAIGLLVGLLVWLLWPVRQKSLQTPTIQKPDFTQAFSKVYDLNETERLAEVKPECHSKLYSHGKPTAKAVVMFHGVSACPQQFSGLAQYFFDRGYNVYVPLAPEHGRTDNLNHAKVTAQSLVDYTNAAINVTSALGSEVGVVGLSGGADLNTWAIQYHPDIKRALMLSPFYEPSVSQTPKWQIYPFLVLYGHNLLPDQLNKPDDPQHALSYRALAKYVTVYKNLPKKPGDTNLKNLAVVMADDDKEIDQPLALKTLNAIAKANGLNLVHDQLPAELKLGHDIISPDNEYVVQHQEFLHAKYLELYER